MSTSDRALVKISNGSASLHQQHAYQIADNPILADDAVPSSQTSSQEWSSKSTHDQELVAVWRVFLPWPSSRRSRLLLHHVLDICEHRAPVFSPWRTHEHFQLNYTNDLRILCLIPWFHWLLDLTIRSCYKDFKLYKSKIKPTILHLRWLAFRGSSLCPQCCVLLVDLPGRRGVGPKQARARPDLALESPSSHWALSSEEARPPQTQGRGKLNSSDVWPTPTSEQRKANRNPEKHRCGFQLGRQTLQALLLANRPRCWAWAPGGSSSLQGGIQGVQGLDSPLTHNQTWRDQQSLALLLTWDLLGLWGALV